MDEQVFVLRNRRMPWGDYGDILLSGMTGHLPREHGSLQLERTGPFVPPIAITGFDVHGFSHIVVSDPCKLALEQSTLSGLRFLPVLKRRIVRLGWEHWDQLADEPLEYPETGEPEDYILGRPHDPSVADAMGALWEVCLEPHARTDRQHRGPGPWDVRIWLVRASWDGTDWFRAEGTGEAYVSQAVSGWLERAAPQSMAFEAAEIR